MDRELKILKAILNIELVIGCLLTVFIPLMMAAFSTDAPTSKLWIAALVFLATGAISTGLFYFVPIWAITNLEKNPPSAWGAVLQGIPGGLIEGPLWFIIFPLRIILAVRIHKYYSTP